MGLNVRIRFEVFKRDDFRCQYCGRRSPDVVLEVDHIVARANGGSDDPINLRTSCWECNRGKGAVSLEEIATGEDPHDRAILLLERERQLREYNAVVATERDRRELDAWELWRYWQLERGKKSEYALSNAPAREFGWIRNALVRCPKEQIKTFMDLAVGKQMTDDLRYVGACVRNWCEDHDNE